MNKIKNIIQLSKLIITMQERGATEEELLNVVEFFKVISDNEIEDNVNIYEFELIRKYHNKYN